MAQRKGQPAKMPAPQPAKMPVAKKATPVPQPTKMARRIGRTR